MIKNFFISAFLFFSIANFAQQGTSSPYSFYGIGDIRFKGTIESRSMGSLTFVSDSIHIEVQNPALLSSLKYTTLGFGGTFSPTVLSTTYQNEKSQRTTLDYISVGLPAKKMAFGFGLIPYSYVGYNFLNDSADGNQKNLEQGKGGINRVYSTISYKINSKFNVGVDLQYNFGTIETKSITAINYVEYATREINKSGVGGFSLTAGLSYKSKITEKLHLYSGLTYTPHSSLNLSNSRELATVLFDFTGNETVVGESLTIVVANSTIKLPSKLSVGAGIGENKKWFLGTEITLKNNNGFSNRFDDITNVRYENATKWSIGGYYIPKYNSFSNYLKRATYRGGFRYENSGLIVNNTPIKEQAFTLGVGFPVSGTFSNINIGLEIGKRGTRTVGLIQENFSNISVGLSFNDRWFVKRKYD